MPSPDGSGSAGPAAEAAARPALPTVIGTTPRLLDTPPPCPSRPDGRHAFDRQDAMTLGDLGWVDHAERCYTNVFTVYPCTNDGCGAMRVHADLRPYEPPSKTRPSVHTPGLLLGFVPPGDEAAEAIEIAKSPVPALDAAKAAGIGW